ncbi:MAG: hypothetical protein Q4G04_04405 [bacterium]|nr:hypothetical protein [bacterium]
MVSLTTVEMNEIQGGAGWGWAFGITAAVAFIIGIIDGVVRLLPCR